MTSDSRNWFIFAMMIVGAWLVYLLAPVITPFAISAVLAYLGDPLVDRLEKVSVKKWQVGRTLAVTVVFILILSALTIVLLIIIPLLIEQVQLLIKRLPQWVEWASQTGLPWIASRLGFDIQSFDQPRITQMLQDYWKEISSATFKVIDMVSKGGLAVVALVTNLVLIPVVTFYLLRDWDSLVTNMRDLLPRSMEGPIGSVLSEVDDVLGAFFRGQLMVMTALGIIYAVGLSLVGVEFAVLIGLGAGLLSIVPYLGTAVGLVVATLAAIFQFQDIFHPLMVLSVFVAGQMAEGMYLTPKLVGDQIGLHPVTVIFAVLAGGQLFGFLGILLALPVAAALNVLVRHAQIKYRNSNLYSSSSDAGE
jgi:predicted PurR-regulated permease PerM